MTLSRQKLTLIGIFALFMGPVILVMLMRSDWWQYQPAKLQNRGELVQPAEQLPLQRHGALSGKWVILYLLEQPCEQPCLEYATALRQIHTASGRNREHLAVALLTRNPVDASQQSALQSIYPGFVLLEQSTPAVWQTLRSVGKRLAGEPGDMDPVRSYVLDPAFNLVLAYRASNSPDDIHKDLKRLLKLSEQEKTR